MNNSKGWKQIEEVPHPGEFSSPLFVVLTLHFLSPQRLSSKMRAAQPLLAQMEYLNIGKTHFVFKLFTERNERHSLDCTEALFYGYIL